MAINYADLQYFLEVAQTRNISRAAERIGISQPSLSAAMRRLEEALDVDLLVRGRTGVHLTKAGEALVRRGRLLLMQWSQLKAEVKRCEDGVSGQFLLGCHPSVATYALPLFLPGLLSEFPELEVRLIHNLSRRVLEQVVSVELDFGLVMNPVRHPDLVIIKLCTDDVLFWTASPPSATQVLDAEAGVLVCDLELAQAQHLLGALGKRQGGFRRVVSSNNLEVITALTAAGVGVGILPRRVATRPGAGALEPLGDGLPAYKDTLCLVYRADLPRTRAVEVIIEAIKAAFRSAG